ncbi:hypothetical protein [Streptomyces sp. KL116D]|uniref:hypothetical protein n=1 Tax=Streptomyces sp. KL116D TaxID=3045152 RepID=UPI0035561673
MRPRGDHAHSTNAESEQAREQFGATGYAGTRWTTSPRSPARKGSLYGALGDKRKLFHRVLDDWCTAVAEVAEERLAGGLDSEALGPAVGIRAPHGRRTPPPPDTERRGVSAGQGRGPNRLPSSIRPLAGRPAETMGRAG